MDPAEITNRFLEIHLPYDVHTCDGANPMDLAQDFARFFNGQSCMVFVRRPPGKEYWFHFTGRALPESFFQRLNPQSPDNP